MTATLKYFIGHDSSVTFELDCTKTIVGRRPAAVEQTPEYAEQITKRKPFVMRRSDTLFLVCADTAVLAPNHFAIERTQSPSGRIVFLIDDLGSHCAFLLNGVEYTGSPMPLSNGDRITCGHDFEFRTE